MSLKLSPVERDRLEIFVAAQLARSRRARGLKLCHPEAVALICDEVLEAARDGKSYAEVCNLGYEVLGTDDVLDGVAELIDVIRVEPLFEEGTLMVSLFNPIGGVAPRAEDYAAGQDAFVVVNKDAGEPIEISVVNVVDRAIQVTSHYHFFEVTRGLRFDRARAFGYRLDIASGGSTRFEPGEKKSVRLIPIGGRRYVYGQAGLTQGFLDDPEVKERALAAAKDQGYMEGKPDEY